MLIIQRKVNEEVVLGVSNEIIVKVIEIKQSSVKIGFEAPLEIPINAASIDQGV